MIGRVYIIISGTPWEYTGDPTVVEGPWESEGEALAAAARVAGPLGESWPVDPMADDGGDTDLWVSLPLP